MRINYWTIDFDGTQSPGRFLEAPVIAGMGPFVDGTYHLFAARSQDKMRLGEYTELITGVIGFKILEGMEEQDEK
jgi:hypothetical protein